MSEAPTHSAVPTPNPARPQQNPQQNERTSQTERQAEHAAQTERHAEDRTPQTEQRGQHTERMPQQQSQRIEQQRTEAQRTESQRAETPRSEQRPSSKLEDEWQAVQYEFVDDPKAAVRKADDLVTKALEELTSRHRSLTKQLEGNGDPQTEDLRLALHRYRELFKSLVAVK